jgi:hypothetical protein
MSSSSPDSEGGVATVTVPPIERKGMRHRLYDHKEVPKIIAQFIKNNIFPPMVLDG